MSNIFVYIDKTLYELIRLEIKWHSIKIKIVFPRCLETIEIKKNKIMADLNGTWKKLITR